MDRDPLTRNNVVLAGNPNAAKTLVFVNGLGTSQSVWNAVSPAFENDFRLVFFDHVGSVPENFDDFRRHQVRYLNISGYALDLLEICSALKLNHFTTLIGHSLGAIAALLATIQRPNQFNRLVLLGASPRYANTTDYEGGFSDADITAIYERLQGDPVAWAQGFADAALANSSKPHMVLHLAAALQSIPKDMMLTVLCSVLQADHRKELPQVTRPVLLVQSREDFFVPNAVARYAHAHLPNSTLKTVDARGHLPHLTEPSQVVEAIRDFVGCEKI